MPREMSFHATPPLAEALLAGFQRLHVVGGGEAARAEKRQEAVEPALRAGPAAR